ncbi:MAG: OmpH family outer membrane protein [Bacteroidales bacterium]|nr:OmpH family outer membrane protein [Bacteroidales bacterium]
MKRLFFTLVIAIAAILPANAQKVGFIDTDSVLNALPDYQAAVKKLDSQAEQYRQQLDAELQVIDQIYNAYQNQKSRLTTAQRSSIENDIITREQQLKANQEKYFGSEGLMAQNSEKLLAPIRTRVEKAVAQYASANGYSLILDLAVTAGVVYKKDSDDLTKAIIKMLK